MGYRLEISAVKYRACGGKLYGYSDEKELKSHKYLVEKGYLDGDEYFGYGFNPSILLRADEFKEFIKLYNEDYNESRQLEGEDKDCIINDRNIKELLENDENKLLEWY